MRTIVLPPEESLAATTGRAPARIYLLKTGLRYGPYSLSELQQQLDSGSFSEEDYASSDDCKNWLHIAEVSGLVSRNFTVETNPAENLLIIRYRGRVNALAAEQCLHAVRRAIEELDPGFQVLADFSELESMDIACAPQLEKIMDLCDEKEISTVARVIPHPLRDIGLEIMSRFHYRPEVRTITCATLEEAMNRLSHASSGAIADEEIGTAQTAG